MCQHWYSDGEVWAVRCNQWVNPINGTLVRTKGRVHGDVRTPGVELVGPRSSTSLRDSALGMLEIVEFGRLKSTGCATSCEGSLVEKTGLSAADVVPDEVGYT